MKMKLAIAVLLLSTMATIASASRTITVTVSNPTNNERNDVPVVISLKAYGEVRSALISCNGKEIPCQLDDLDKDDIYPHTYQWRLGDKYDAGKAPVLEEAIKKGVRIADTEAYEKYIQEVKSRKFEPDSWD